MPCRHAIYLFLLVLISGCSAPKYLLTDGRYAYKQPGEKFQEVYAYVDQDSVSVFKDIGGTKPLVPQVLKDEIFIKQSLDIDILLIPFKARSATANLPRQLTTDFNGNIFFGYRVDRFRFMHRKTPIGLKRGYTHTGVTIGGFGGLGTAAITPWTTNNQMSDEYNGFVLSRGVALMFGISNVTVGVGLGWDYLTDRDKHIWIYQNKSWYGLTFSLNLN